MANHEPKPRGLEGNEQNEQLKQVADRIAELVAQLPERAFVPTHHDGTLEVKVTHKEAYEARLGYSDSRGGYITPRSVYSDNVDVGTAQGDIRVRVQHVKAHKEVEYYPARSPKLPEGNYTKDVPRSIQVTDANGEKLFVESDSKHKSTLGLEELNVIVEFLLKAVVVGETDKARIKRTIKETTDKTADTIKKLL